MTGLEYEKLVAKYLKNHGYYDVTVTKGSGDFGIDIIARKGAHKYAVQCKYYTSAVSLDAVQEAVAGMAYYNCDKAMVVTNNTYSPSARQLAKCNNVILLENISSAETKVNFKFAKWLLLAVYIFISSAALSSAFDVIKTQSFWFSVYNIATLILVLTAPLWIWVIYKLIKKKFLNKPKANAEETHQITTPHTAPIKYANSENIYNFLFQNDFFITVEDIEKIIVLEIITASKIQRTLGYGYARATKLIDLLLKGKYLNMISDYTYEWS